MRKESNYSNKDINKEDFQKDLIEQKQNELFLIILVKLSIKIKKYEIYLII